MSRVYGAAVAVLAVWLGWSVRREPARPHNPVLLGSLLVATVLWLAVVTADDLVLESRAADYGEPRMWTHPEAVEWIRGR